MSSSPSTFDLSRPVPILVLGDGPDQKTGLGRIGHDLAWLLSSIPEFKVGYLGRMAFGRSKFPWAQYSFPESGQWGEQSIEQAWDDLSQNRRGVIFTVWDASRLLWFADPVGINGRLGDFLRSGRFERWGYFMQDSAGILADRLPLEVAHVFTRYDRVCLASKWAHGISVNSVQHPDLDWLPHGINRETFKPVDRLYARSAWNLNDSDVVIGCVMTNQERKHWPTVMEAVARMNLKPWLWIHTDQVLGYWNLTALAVEYGIVDRVINERRELSDAELAMRYSACDATVLISGGEGFCYPIAESLSCGTPTVTGGYSAQAELVAFDCLVSPKASRIVTNHNARRAVYDAEGVAKALEHAVAGKQAGVNTTMLVEHLDWSKLGVVWKKWMKRGIA